MRDQLADEILKEEAFGNAGGHLLQFNHGVFGTDDGSEGSSDPFGMLELFGELDITERQLHTHTGIA